MNSKLYNLLLRGWFRTKGRSGRQEYILRFLMMWVFMYLSLFFGKLYSSYESTTESIFGLSLAVFLLFILLIILISSVIQVFFVTHRRLHDLNSSGWWQLVTFIPFGQLLMIGFIFFKGTQGINKYGEPPTY